MVFGEVEYPLNRLDLGRFRDDVGSIYGLVLDVSVLGGKRRLPDIYFKGRWCSLHRRDMYVCKVVTINTRTPITKEQLVSSLCYRFKGKI